MTIVLKIRIDFCPMPAESYYKEEMKNIRDFS